ncbi:MAG: pyridoxal-phosphate dependent enzyme [Promethearchaeota archaeon]
MISYNDVKDAYNRIKSYINRTPVMKSHTLNQMLRAEIYFKCENFQKVGAFKFRGAMNAVLQLSDKQKKRGVITHSSGNHAQALALAAKMLNIGATIVMPENAPKVKVNAVRDTYKAKVVMCESTPEGRERTCNEIQSKEGQTLIHPYNNDNIIAGAGTSAYELLQDYPDLDIIIAPVGGGGLLSGTSIAAKGFNSNLKVYAAEPKNADDAYRSFHSGKIENNISANTIADGLRTNLCERTFTIIRKNVEEIITVSETEILEAMRFIWERLKIVIEPSSAVPLAALFTRSISIKDKKIGVIISGGNIDLTDFYNLLRAKISK